MRRKWKDIPGSLAIEVCDYAPEVSTPDGERVPSLDGRIMDTCEVIIDYTRSGYYDPGCMYLNNGDPGYPPEGDDYADLVEAYLLIDSKRTDLPRDVQDDLFTQFYDRIMDEECNEAYHDHD